jgi:hypothetical protein
LRSIYPKIVYWADVDIRRVPKRDTRKWPDTYITVVGTYI